ncbi:MAG: Hpt domain-containing protein [Myxococcales bacterium]|nr:Hpt domain-containing protein [Myxococcales bacterium]MCB9753028.1 Hpt domain-containing protein [Myxococcales bacterium]
MVAADELPDLDAEVFDRLYRLTGPEMLEEVTEEYIRHLDAAVPQLRELVTTPGEASRRELELVAHGLKGSSSTYGARRVSVLAQLLEDDCKRGVDVRAAVEVLCRAIASTRRTVVSMMRRTVHGHA